MNNTLEKKEAADLARLEKVIAGSLNTFKLVGKALTEIMDRRLYREKYGSFAEYMEERWGLGRQRGYQIIAGFNAAKELPEHVSTMVDTERKARALAKVPKEKRQKLMENIAKLGKKVTGKAIERAAKEEKVAEKDIELDAIGRPIPDNLIPLWNRSSEVQELLSSISSVKSVLKKAQDAGDPLYSEVHFSTAIPELERAYTAIKCTKPFAVCPTCQGHPELQPKKQCEMCRGRGMIGDFRYKAVSVEMRKILEKGAKK